MMVVPALSRSSIKAEVTDDGRKGEGSRATRVGVALFINKELICVLADLGD